MTEKTPTQKAAGDMDFMCTYVLAPATALLALFAFAADRADRDEQAPQPVTPTPAQAPALAEPTNG